MSNAPSFVEHALDLISLLGPVQARPMFGGHGLYAQGVMFGLLDDDELFVRTDDESRPRFVSASCRMWVYPGMAQTSYYRPPDEAHEDPEAMLPWARLGLESALRLKAARDAVAQARAARRAEREVKAGTPAAKPPAPPVRSLVAAKAPGAKPAGKKTAPAKRRSAVPKAATRRTAAVKRKPAVAGKGPAARKPARRPRGKR